MIIHNHSIKKISIRDFPITKEYNYLGITINNCGSIDLHMRKIKKTTEYITNKLKWASIHCSLRKKILIWKCYVRPYFLYTLPLLDIINKLSTEFIYQLWRKTFKKLTGFPKSTPNQIIYQLSDNPEHWGKYLTYITHEKITRRKLNISNKYIKKDPKMRSKPEHIKGENLQFLPNNYTKIFKYSHMKCAECIGNPHINYVHYLSHAGIDIKEIDDIITSDYISDTFKNEIKSDIERKIEDVNIKMTDIELESKKNVRKRKEKKIIKHT